MLSKRILGRMTQVRLLSSGIVSSPFPKVAIPEKTLSEVSLREADRLASFPAISCGLTGRSMTYGEVKLMSRKFAAGLLDAGLTVDNKVATILPNIPEFSSILYGTTDVGATLVPVSPLLAPPELARIFDLTKPNIIITLTAFVPVVKDIVKKLPGNKPLVMTLDFAEPAEKIGDDTFQNFVQSQDENKSGQKKDFDVKKTVAVMPFSSGTTGPPKGVMLSHYNLNSTISQFNNKESGCSTPVFDPETEEEQNVLMSALPVFHIYGLACNIIQPFSLGAHVVQLPKFEPQMFVDCLSKYRPHSFNLVPPLISFIAANPAITRKHHLERSRIMGCGGAPLSSVVLQQLENKIRPSQVEIKEGYGMTECPVICRIREKKPELFTVGPLINNTDGKVVDTETGEAVGPNVHGEICVRGPQVMLGYYKNEAATSDTIRDGWLHTGDIGFYNDKGEFFIVDRIKDLIKVKGHQVSPTDLEEAIRPLPGVADICIIGVPHEKFGEAPRAYIVKDKDDIKEDDIHEWLVGKVATYKYLSGGIRFLSELPKSPTGKVLRKELRKMAQSST